MAYHVLSWFFGNGEATPLVLHCKHTLTQWILTDEFEKAHSACLTQVPPHSGVIPITFLNQTKVDSFCLIPPHFNNDMNAYSGHLKTAVNSQKVYYAPRVGAGISAEKYDLMGIGRQKKKFEIKCTTERLRRRLLSKMMHGKQIYFVRQISLARLLLGLRAESQGLGKF